MAADVQNKGLFARIRDVFRASPENPSTSLSNPATWLTSLFGVKATSGATVNIETTISLPAFWRALNILGETIGSLPFEVIEESKDGSISVNKSHPIASILNVEPSKHYTSFTYRHTSMVHAVFGNWISLIIREKKSRQVKQLVILDPNDVEIKADKNDVFYKVTKGMYKGDYSSDDIIHVPNLSLNGVSGVNVINTMTDSFGMGLSARDYVNTYHAKGSMIAGVIEFPEKMGDKQYLRLKESFRLEYGGAKNAGTTPLLEGGAKYKQINANLNESQSLETQRFNISDISRITGIPNHMLSDLERSTNNNIEQQSLELTIYTIRPWVKRIEQEFNRKIFRADEKGKTKVRLNLDALLRGNIETRTNLYTALWNIGGISVNEVRRREKMNPVKGGDTRYMPLNFAPVGDDGLPINDIIKDKL